MCPKIVKTGQRDKQLMVTRVCLSLPKHLQQSPIPSVSHRTEAAFEPAPGRTRPGRRSPSGLRTSYSQQGDRSYSVWSVCHRLYQAFHTRSSLRHIAAAPRRKRSHGLSPAPCHWQEGSRKCPRVAGGESQDLERMLAPPRSGQSQT